MWTAVPLRDGHDRGGCHGGLPQDEPHVQLLQEVLVALVRGLCVASCKAKNVKTNRRLMWLPVTWTILARRIFKGRGGDSRLFLIESYKQSEQSMRAKIRLQAAAHCTAPKDSQSQSRRKYAALYLCVVCLQRRWERAMPKSRQGSTFNWRTEFRNGRISNSNILQLCL